MQTHFNSQQLQRPEIAEADSILRQCVHCGFCTATCPTFVLTGDERDSPRGRIWMIRDLLGGGEQDRPGDADQLGYHLDRCLSCLSCMTTCPSGVDYMHLVDIGRAEAEKTHRRPLTDRLLRRLLVWLVPRAGLFHKALMLARFIRPLAGLMPGRMKAMLRLAPKLSVPLDRVGGSDQTFSPQQKPIKKVILLQGCAQRAINPEINAATLRLLSRFGISICVRQQAGCCGGLAHHINDSVAARSAIRRTAAAWKADIDAGDIDAIIVNTSGCGTTLKDYGHLLADDSELAGTGKKIAALAMDITEFLAAHCALPEREPVKLSVVYHAACSLQHGQKVTQTPKSLLQAAGFTVLTPPEAHLCCGSAGVYNILQPALSDGLKARKLAAISHTGADIAAAGNLGCINQLSDLPMPVCHTIQLLDWAYGGPMPAELAGTGLSS